MLVLNAEYTGRPVLEKIPFVFAEEYVACRYRGRVKVCSDFGNRHMIYCWGRILGTDVKTD